MIADDIRPILWGMGYLAFGVIIVGWVGLMWGLVIMGIIGLIGICIGKWLLPSSKGKKENGGDNES